MNSFTIEQNWTQDTSTQKFLLYSNQLDTNAINASPGGALFALLFPINSSSIGLTGPSFLDENYNVNRMLPPFHSLIILSLMHFLSST